MYVLIDMEDMVVRHKHPDHGTLSSLAKIELSHTKAKIIPVTTEAVSTLTDMELRLLHSHVTGEKITPAPLHRITKEALEVLRQLPDSNVNAFEVKQQADKIAMKDSGFYRYVRGSYTAKKVEELFLPDPVDVNSPPHVATVAPAPTAAPREQGKTVAHAPQLPSVLPAWHPASKRA